MNYQKVDAALATALAEVEDREARVLGVFIHTESDLSESAIAFLESLGISHPTQNQTVYTVTLSANAVAQLTDQPWVRYLRLSQRLKLAGQG